MEKINIAELLKDCPRGMELDCLLYDNVTFERFDVEQNRCYFKAGPADTFWTTCYGKINGSPFGKCIIFPKGKTTWEGFTPPYRFKDGDILFVKATYSWIIIYKECGYDVDLYKYVGIPVGIPDYPNYTFMVYDCNPLCCKKEVSEIRLATEEEKEKLFDAIKDKGYRWNHETKTLEKLIEPEFKIGDKVRHKTNHNIVFTIDGIEEDFYTCAGKMVFCFNDQDEYELAQNKFDINTLKPFDKVLVRDKCSDVWTANFYSHYDATSDRPFVCVGWSEMNEYRYCIPYEANKELLGTTNNIE